MFKQNNVENNIVEDTIKIGAQMFKAHCAWHKNVRGAIMFKAQYCGRHN